MEPVGSAPDARTYVVTADRTERAHLYSALMGDWYHRPSSWWRPLVLGLLGVALLLGGPVPWAYAVVVGLLMAVLLFFLSWRRYEKSVVSLLDRSWFAGSRHEAVFDDRGVLLRGPLGEVEYRWELVDHVRHELRVVAIHLRAGGVRQYVPASLFPVEEVTAARRRLAGHAG